MDETTITLLFRGVERCMIVLAAALFAYLGYKLFLAGKEQGPGKLEVGKSPLGKIVFSGAGPGLFFMAFGALVLMVALVIQVRVESPRGWIEQRVEPVSEEAEECLDSREEPLTYIVKVIGGDPNVRKMIEDDPNIGILVAEDVMDRLNRMIEEGRIKTMEEQASDPNDEGP